MTITRSVLFASLLGTAAFGCRNTSDNRDDMNQAPKPVESTSTSTSDQGSPTPMSGGQGTTGTPSTTGTPGTTGTPTTPGTQPGTTPQDTWGQTGSAGATATPPVTTPSTSGSAVGTGTGSATPNPYNGTQGSAALPEAGSDMTPPTGTQGSALNPQQPTTPGTIDQSGSAVNPTGTQNQTP
jgi:hypothetical protein